MEQSQITSENTEVNLNPTLQMYKKLALIQAEVPTMIKEETADAGKFRWDYISLPQVIEEIKPLLDQQDLFYHWVIQGSNIRIELVDLTTGCIMDSSIKLGDNHDKFQEIGKQITYYSRYLLLNLLGIVAEKDDDGAQYGSKRKQSSQRRTRKSQVEEEDDFDYDDIDFDEEEPPTRKKLPTRSRRGGRR